MEHDTSACGTETHVRPPPRDISLALPHMIRANNLINSYKPSQNLVILASALRVPSDVWLCCTHFCIDSL